MAPATKLLYLCRTCKNSAEASAVVVSWVLGRGHTVDEQEAWEVVSYALGANVFPFFLLNGSAQFFQPWSDAGTRVMARFEITNTIPQLQ